MINLQSLGKFSPRYLVITSDEHSPPSMNRGAWASRPEIRGDFERACMEVDNWCAAHCSEGIVRISTGDTLDSFEPYPDRLAWLSEYFSGHLEKCQAYFYIQGQHDRVQQCPESTWLNVAVKNQKMVYAHRHTAQINDMLALFHDNESPAKLFDFLNRLTASESDAATLFCHQLWHPWLPSNRSAASLADIPPYITWLISGDYHVQKQDTVVTRYQRQLSAWSVGPFHIQDISEPAACRFLVYDFQEKQMLSVPLTCRPVFRFEIYTQEALDEFECTVSRWDIHHDEFSVDKPIVKFKYDSALDKAPGLARAVCNMRAHLFLDPVVAIQSPSAEIAYARSDKEDVHNCLEARGIAQGSISRELVDIAMSVNSPSELEVKFNEIRETFLRDKANAHRKADASAVLPAC